MQVRIITDLEALLTKLPPSIQETLWNREDLQDLLEVVLDVGRKPEARILHETIPLSSKEVTEAEIAHIVEGIGQFGDDNRAGIERTLHRISAMRNRKNKIVGLTLRVGRAVYGTISVIEDLIFTGKSLLLVGKPGVGKTTMLREVARVLADDGHKRVIVVDTSNEIAGDGDIPHPAIGSARRMQVPTPASQHAVMIEAVENHMPEVIIIDEIGTELEASAARTIAERGVQLVATAHGNTLENLTMNPTLSDLVGGVHTVTLGDLEARRRRTQKTVLERRSPPTFDVLVEIQDWNTVVVHPEVADVVDRILRGFPISPQTRTTDELGRIKRINVQQPTISSITTRNGSTSTSSDEIANGQVITEPSKIVRILPYGVNKGKLQQVIKGTTAPVELVSDIGHAELLVTTKNYYNRKTQALRTAENEGKPVYVLRKNTMAQIEQFIHAIARKLGQWPVSEAHVNQARVEAEEAIARIDQGEGHVQLDPQAAYVRRLQHEIADRYGFSSSSMGREPRRHVVIYRH